MKFSEMWLREWVNPSIDNIELMNQLTMLGFKVEESKPVITNIFYGITIGKIIESKIHPLCDNMSIIKVNIGDAIPNSIQIVHKFAIYLKKNIRVVIANVGALLPNGTKVKLTTIKGQLSEGMICSFSMLGLIEYTEDIIELPMNAPVGESFYKYLHFDDNIININITPNRGDCLSVMGIAREIATINQIKLKKLQKYKYSEIIADKILGYIETPKACPQLFGKIIKNININVSTPLWIKEKLRRSGICSVNVVTDISNYVLLELGHPIYIFDYLKIIKNTIRIRFSKKEEKLKLKNNDYLTLYPKTLIIADYEKPLAIAGFTNENNYSYIHRKTSHLFLQSAFFDPSVIINQSKLYNFPNCSFFIRYTKGVDPNISKFALDRITSLLLKICKSGDSGPTTNIIIKNMLPKQKNIIINQFKLDQVLGFHINYQKVRYILKNLGFKIIFKNNYWKVSIPSWRFDLLIEENIISEIVRTYGYDKIPNTPIYTSLITSQNSIPTISISRVKFLLIDRGYQEIITYSFVNAKIQNVLFPKQKSLILTNPITSDMSVMRLSLWTGLLQTTIYNQNRQEKNIKLFESGICFIPKNNIKQLNQNLMIAGIRTGMRFNEHWDLKKCKTDFYDIKGDIEALMSTINKIDMIKFKRCIHPTLHPNQSASIYFNDVIVGYVGVINPIIQKILNLRTSVLLFELTWDMISTPILPKIGNISKFPKIYRDISLLIPDSIESATIIDVCKKTMQDELIEIKLIDVYTGKHILQGFKSITIKLFLQSKTHTLQESEIIKIINQCVSILKEQFHAILR